MALPLFLASACVTRPHPLNFALTSNDSCFVSNHSAMSVAGRLDGLKDVPDSEVEYYTRGLMEFVNESSQLPDAMDILNAAF